MSVLVFVQAHELPGDPDVFITFIMKYAVDILLSIKLVKPVVRIIVTY
jgi:hypothetical protein